MNTSILEGVYNRTMPDGRLLNTPGNNNIHLDVDIKAHYQLSVKDDPTVEKLRPGDFLRPNGTVVSI